MKIAHIGDCHLGLGYPGPTPESRLEDIGKVMDFAAEYCIEHDVELVLFAGDAFKDSRVMLDRAAIEIKAFTSWLRKLSDAEIPVVAISGTPSHDAVAAYEIIREMNIPGVRIVTKPEIVDISGPTYGDNIAIACLPGLNRSALATKEEFAGLTPRQMHQVMTEKIKQICWGLAAQCHGPKVLLSHMTFAGLDTGFDEMLMASEPVLTPEAVVPFPLVCLGHIHKAQRTIISETNNLVVYCGSPDRLTFNDEEVVPGFWVHDNFDGTHEFVETPARRYLTIERDIEPELMREGLPVGHFYPDDIDQAKGAIVRVRITCTEDQARLIDRKVIEKGLYDIGAFYVTEISLEVQRQDRARNTEVTETVGPIEAVREWGAGQQLGAGEIENLMTRTGDLLEEARV